MAAMLLALHSIVRWAVVLFALLLLSRAVNGVRTRRDWAPADHRFGLGFIISFDLQFLIGLALFHFSTLTPDSLEGFKGAMHVPALRFFAVEHTAGMVLALAAAHISWAKGKRAADAARRFRTVAIGTGLSLLLVVLSIPWPWMAVGRRLWP